MYNFVLISAAQQSDSVTHIQTLFLIFFSTMVCHWILNIVPCAIQEDLVAHPSYVFWFASANSKVPLHPSSTPLLLGSHESVLYVCESVCFIDKFICVLF